MAPNDDEIDFSSYLVDLDDEDESANAAGFPKAAQSSSNSGFNMSFPQQMSTYAHPQMHSAKNWPNALLQFNIPTGSISPSPPETGSDSSYKASTTANSTPSTAASSIASTSYTGSHGSWRTERATSLKEQVMYHQSRPQGSNQNGQSVSTYGNVASIAGATPSSSQPFNLSFDYDFTHDPSATASGSHTPVGNASGTASSSSSRRGSLLAASMPTSTDWPGLSSQQSTLASQSFNSAFSENLIPPSSGPTSAAHRPPRSRQSSNVAFPAGTSPGGAASSWAALGCISEKVPIISSIASSYPSKPYSRPDTASSGNLANGSGNHGSLSRKSSKRKSTSSSTALSFASLSEQKNANPAHSLPSQSTRAQTQSSASSPSDLYRDPASAFASPISPVVDTFPSFAVPSSSTTSPSHRGSSNANTPSDGANASELTLLASPINTSALSACSSGAVDVDKAAAMAGLGPKWFNWASQQEQSSQPVISSVLSQQTQLLSPASPSRIVPAQSGSVAASSAPSQTDLLLVQSGRAPQSRAFSRETSLAPEALTSWPDLEDQSPEALAANDPLATQLWRMVNKAKAGLPSGARMENLTWRMMSLRVNKQKEKQAAAEKAAEEQAQIEAKRAAAAQSLQAARSTVEEDGRGRKARTASQSASPNEGPAADDFMDWRQASRSRSRPSSVMAMDWRGNSRSRSRAPNMRISIPASPSTFVSPLHADFSAQDYAYQGDLGQPAPPEATNTAATGTVSTGKGTNNGPTESLEETLKNFMAQHAAMTNSASQCGTAFAAPSSAPLTFDNDLFAQTSGLTANNSASLTSSQNPASSGSLPVSYNAWQPSVDVVDNSHAQSYTSAAASLTLPFEDNTNLPPMPQSTFVNESRDSISASVEAYLKSLDYGTSVLDLPVQRHAGSVPGIFREQDLKVNQHADYGFLPKLVRKTSFDASYPAALQKKSKSAQPKPSEAQNKAKAAASAQQAAQTRNTVAQSTPGTPVAAFANTPFDFTSVYNTASPQVSMPSSAEVLHAMSNPYAASSQAAAVEAFRRLQYLQAHASMQNVAAQPGLSYSPYMDPNMMAMAAAASATSSIMPGFAPAPSTPYDVFPQSTLTNSSQALADASMAQAVFNNDQQLAWLQSMQMPSPLPSLPQQESDLVKSPAPAVRDAPTPAAASEVPVNGETTSDVKGKNRAVASAGSNASSTNTHKKSHSRSHSTASDAATTATLAPSVNPDGTSITCVNCKTTTTPLWRRDENGQPLCNACQLFRKLHGSDRPVSLHNGVIKKRNRARNNQKDIPKKTGSRSRRTSVAVPQEEEDSINVN